MNIQPTFWSLEKCSSFASLKKKTKKQADQSQSSSSFSSPELDSLFWLLVPTSQKESEGKL